MAYRWERKRKNFNIPGNAHALTWSCYRRFKLLDRDRTRRWLAQSIELARRELDFRVWAYVFMPEHVHLLVYPNRCRYDIADIREAIKEPVANWAMEHLERTAPEWLSVFTRQRGRRTERLFWQSGGGFDRNLSDGRALLAEIDYIHANPVRRKLVTSPTDWHWSSASWYASQEVGPLAIDPIPKDWLE